MPEIAITTPDTQSPLPEYSADGVDLSLIRWMLSLSPIERLRFLQRQINCIVSIRTRNAKP